MHVIAFELCVLLCGFTVAFIAVFGTVRDVAAVIEMDECSDEMKKCTVLA